MIIGKTVIFTGKRFNGEYLNEDEDIIGVVIGETGGQVKFRDEFGSVYECSRSYVRVIR